MNNIIQEEQEMIKLHEDQIQGKLEMEDTRLEQEIEEILKKAQV